MPASSMPSIRPVLSRVRSSFFRRLGGPLVLGTSVLGAQAALAPAQARAAEPALTRARIAELVDEAPAARAAASQVGVAEAAVVGARVLSRQNPVLSGLAGVRFNPDGTRPLAASGSLSWPVDIGGQRGARIDAAKAERRAAVAGAQNTKRDLLLAALLRHALVLRAERALALAAERRALSERVRRAAEKRRAVGDVADLDVALATLQEQRDRAAEANAAGDRDADRLVLLAALGLPEAPVPVAGPLVPPDEPPPLAVLVRALGERTDLKAAAAELEAARSRLESERAARWPTINLLAQYERDDAAANIVTGGVAVPLPILNPNRAGVATANAELKAARARLQATRATAGGSVQRLYARYLATKRALSALAPATTLARTALALSTRAYELGENNLASVLLARREALETQAALIEAELAHASAKLELLVASGRAPR